MGICIRKIGNELPVSHAGHFVAGTSVHRAYIMNGMERVVKWMGRVMRCKLRQAFAIRKDKDTSMLKTDRKRTLHRGIAAKRIHIPSEK